MRPSGHPRRADYGACRIRPARSANMFRTIEQQGGRTRRPGILSSHPAPANRYARIIRKQRARVSNPIQDTREFQDVQGTLAMDNRALVRWKRCAQRPALPHGGGGSDYPQARPSAPRRVSLVAYQTTRKAISACQHSGNWRRLGDNNSVWVCSRPALREVQGQNFSRTASCEIALSPSNSNNLQQATNEFISA